MTALIGTKLNANAFTGAAILALLLSVDGVGSGLDADKLDGNEATAFATAAQGAKADVALSSTDVLDEDTFATNSPTKPPSQQSTKVYIAAELATAIANLVAASPGTLDTLNELAAALGDDPNFAATMTALIGTKLNASTYTAADIFAKILTLHGAGSGLDADKLDGNHAAAFALAGDVAGWGYTSPETTFNDYSSTIFAHPLGAAPTKFSVDFVCKVAVSDYAVGDKIVGLSEGGVGNGHQGMHFVIDAGNTTQVRLICGSQFYVLSKSGYVLLIDATKWKYILKASL